MARAGFILALLIAMPVTGQAQAPRIITSAAMDDMRARYRDSDPFLAARSAEVAAAKARVGAIATRGAFGLAAEIEEMGLSRPQESTVTLSAEQEFEPRAQVAAERALAAARVDVAEANLSSATLLREVSFEQAVLSAHAWSRIRQMLLAEDSVLARAELMLTARFAAGEARYVDVIRLRTERLGVQSEGAEAAARVQSALLLIRAGVPGMTVADIQQRIRGIPELPMPQLPDSSTLLSLSPALRIGEAHVALARAELQASHAQSARRWTAGVGVQRFGGDDGWHFGPVLSGSFTLPIPQRAVREARMLAGAADTVAARSLHSAVARQITTDLEQSTALFMAARQRFSGIDVRLLAAAREERESAIASYGSGDLSLLELLDFERAIMRADHQILTSYLDMVDAWANAWRAAASPITTEEPNR